MYDSSQVLYFKFLEQELLLLPEKALVWLDANILIISDIHLGKAGHFRKSGIAIPSHLHKSDLMRLEDIIKNYDVHKIFFLGDLFHSIYNDEWDSFCKWLEKFPDISMHLIQGNHDILPLNFYTSSSIIVHEKHLVEYPFIFSHIPLKPVEINDGLYNISGHIHPSIRLTGRGRQSISLPCFYFGEKQAIMPAFGAFTGMYPIHPEQSSKIFAIANNKIISI